ncbi:hypothetical protein MVEN_02345700 [Mycena venus]|uniref:Uncharacterized protein n=1 Tax=Mycena venus TaxID=2733690 RepID=A0A8H6X2V7_9AGAR|nr:hypothetical protein MVEN_02345700 [Mycena venus]
MASPLSRFESSNKIQPGRAQHHQPAFLWTTMSLLDTSSLSDLDYARSFDDHVDSDSTLRTPEAFRTPKPIRVETIATIDPADPDFFSGFSREWRRPSPDQLLGFLDSPIAVPGWILGEEMLDFYPPITAKTPALTRPQTLSGSVTTSKAKASVAHHPPAPRDELPVARVASPRIEDAPLGSDDDYDYAAEDEEEQASFLARATVDSSTSAHASSLSAPSPPLSSEVPSPESARDFDTFSDVSESSGRVRSEYPMGWAPDPEFHAQHDAYYPSDHVDIVDEGGYHDLESVTDDDAEGGDEDDEATPSTSSAPSTLTQFEDESEADASYAHNSDGDNDDDSDYEVPPRKQRRTNSGKASAIPVARLPQHSAAKGKGKAPEKARASKSKRGSSEQLLVPADAPRPTFTQDADGKFPCPLRDLGCTQRPLTENGMNRHYSEHHVQKERLVCPTGCGTTFSRMDVLRKHLGGEKIKATCKAPVETVAACLKTLNATKRKRSSQA